MSQAKPKTLDTADLFCGAGGFTSGLVAAAQKLDRQLKVVAINHWDLAIQTHSANHPEATHLCTGVDMVDPKKVVPGGHLHLLIAAPSCTHFSNARGGTPVNDQVRASAWMILRWIEELIVDNIVIENVPAMKTWGATIPLRDKNGHIKKHPITGEILKRPDPRHKGELFTLFIQALKAHGYKVDYRVLCCADYGDPTSRERLFILARRGNRPITWPEPTHSKDGALTLFGQVQKWRAAREIIDWKLQGRSIFDPTRKSLSPNTLNRLWAGLAKISGITLLESSEGLHLVMAKAGKCAAPYVLSINGGKDGYLRSSSVDQPLPTATAHPTGALVEPYIVTMEHSGANGSQVRGVDQPVPTVTGTPRIGVVQPYISTVNHGKDTRAHSVNKPMPTITSVDAWALAEPYVVSLNGTRSKQIDASSRSVEEPLPTVVGSAPHLYVAEPFVLGQQSGSVPRSTGDPIPTVVSAGATLHPERTASGGAGRGRVALAEPYMTKYNGTGGAQSVEDPLDTITAIDRFGLAEPVLVEYHGDKAGKERVRSVDLPLPTVDTSNRFGFAQAVVKAKVGGKMQYGIPVILPDGTRALLDIRFRMLQPHELAGAMSFPKEYQFKGKRRDVVKQIGNAVPVRTAEALCRALLEN